MKKTTEIDRQVVDVVKTALDLGYRHLDGAQCGLPPFSSIQKGTQWTNSSTGYKTENDVGLAMAESGVPRKDIFLTTTAKDLRTIEESLKESLSQFKTDYVDL